MENDLEENGKKTFDLEKEINTNFFEITEKDTYNRSETIKLKEVPLKNYFNTNDINNKKWEYLL